MTKQFQGKTVLVTGGSSGIGLATSTLFARAGANVWLVARDRQRLESALAAVRAGTGQRFGYATADVTHASQVASAVAEATQALGPPDILVNAAGDVHPALFHQADDSCLRSQMDINYFGTVNATRACLPAMLARRSGHIVNVSSVYGFLGGYGYSAYCASKFAVHGFSDSLRAELKPRGIHVSIVYPQNTATPQLEREERLKSPVMKALDTTRVMTPEAVARAIVRGVARRRSVIIPGAEGRFLFWLAGWLGSGTYWVMDRMVAGALKKAGEKG